MTIGWKVWLCSLALTGCVGAADESAATDPDGSELLEVEPQAAPTPDVEQGSGSTLATALATPDEFGSYFSNGVGAFLSAKNDVAELTLYVLPPAKVATFKHPMLVLVMPQDREPVTEANDFEDVTLETGQSHAFHTPAPGTLTQVLASFEY